MSRPRTSATQLVHVLNAASRPIYVLDEEWRVVFCNRPGLQWLGLTEADLLGVRCAYHSSDDVSPAEAAAAGLCPPPGHATDRRFSAAVSGPQGDRQAMFIPLGGGDGSCPLLVIVESDPSADAVPAGEATEGPSWPQLHEQLRRVRRALAAQFRFERLVGSGLAMRRARAQAELAAQSRASLLVVGPPGSGRQHLATAIHHAAQPDAGPLIPLSCSLLSTELMESTVHALAVRQAGKQVAGSLLLNEVDQLSAEVQGDLTAMLIARPFPLRLMATARQSLLELAAAGRFRAELAAVLTTIVIELPPLAQRREDIPLLAQLFLEDLNARGEKQVAGFTPEALDRLDLYPWPGNLDELARVVAEAHAQTEDAEIDLPSLPNRLQLAADALAHPRRKEESIVLDEFLHRVERELILRALKRSKGNKAKAARLLGLTRPRLYRRMVLLGLEQP